MPMHASQARPPLLVVGGMHRSGTSLLASLLTAAGVHLGDDLMAAAESNREGHFEDHDFYLLHQRMLAANGLSLEGFTCEERIDVPVAIRDEAVGLVTRRRAAGRPWGWKDPRTTLFLDFWDGLLPEARWLFVVRPPWEVVDSLFRRGDTAFRANPRFAADVWAAYNRRILEFVQARPERAAVVHASQVAADPAGVVRMASDLLGTPLETPASPYRPELLVTGQPSHRAGLVRAANPEVAEVYRGLLAVAGVDRSACDESMAPLRLAEAAAAGLLEWNRGCQAVAERGGLSALATEARQATDAVLLELAEARELHVRVQAHADDLTRDLVTERTARAEVTAYAEQLARDLARERDLHTSARAQVEELTQDLVTERVARAEVTAYAEQLARDLAAERDLHTSARAHVEELTQDLVAERAARAEVTAYAEQLARDLAAERARAEAFRTDCDTRLAVADREWSSRLTAERARREREAEQLTVALGETRLQADSLAAELANGEATVSRMEAEHAAEITALQRERAEAVARLEAECAALAAQLDAERSIYESLRQDMTGRIEAVRRKAG